MILKIKNIIALVLVTSICLAQENHNDKYISSEIYFNSPYYFTGYKNQFNYGIGITTSVNIQSVKISTGIFYNTKKYFSSYENTSSIEKVTYSLEYYNIPVLAGINLLRQENIKNQLLVSTGIIFNMPRNYSSLTYYKNNNPPTTNDTPIDYKAGSSFRLSLEFHKRLNSIFNIYSCVFADYKFKLDRLGFNNASPQWRPSYSEDRILIGLNVGIGWRYKKE